MPYTISVEKDFSDFEPWSGAVPTWERIKAAGKIDELEQLLDNWSMGVPDHSYSETEINDLLRFEDDEILSELGISDDEED